MILEGNARGFGQELAFHLLNLRDNDHVSVHAIDGFACDDLRGAFAEAEAISGATQCQKYLFSLSLNPPLDATVTTAQFETVVARAEERLGLSGQPRAIVFHEKNGRRHAHVVWSRIDASEMKAINLPHYKRKLMAMSRELFLEHGWEMPPGFQDAAKRDPNRFDRIEAGQAKRAKHDPAKTKAMFRRCWEASDTQAGFAAALSEHGFVLARGDRRGFVAVDAQGKVWSLSRWCGVKSRDLKRKLNHPEHLPDVDEAQRLAQGLGQRAARKQTKDDQNYQNRLAELVAQQRKARAELLKDQRKAEALRLKHQPNAIRLAFLKVTGRYGAFVKRAAQEKADADTKAAQDRQALIDRHLQERRAFEQEHNRHHETSRDRDRGQSFEPKPEPDTLIKARVLRKPELVLAEISKTKASFTRTDVLRCLSRWIDEPPTLSKTADAALTHSDAVRLSSDRTPRYTTQDYQNAEAKLHAAADRLSKASTAPVAPSHITAALKSQNAKMQRAFGGKLSVEQTNAIRSVLDKDNLAQVVGLAGAGKSTLLATAADAWRRQGDTVHGAALAGKAVDGLQDPSGIKSRTLASLELSWENGHTPINRGDVLVIDEAGMVGTRQMARITGKCRRLVPSWFWWATQSNCSPSRPELRFAIWLPVTVRPS